MERIADGKPAQIPQHQNWIAADKMEHRCFRQDDLWVPGFSFRRFGIEYAGYVFVA